MNLLERLTRSDCVTLAIERFQQKVAQRNVILEQDRPTLPHNWHATCLFGRYMPSEVSIRPRSSRRLRQARDVLLDAPANELLQSVRDVLCEPTRTQIVRALSAGPLSVGDLSSILERSKSATSQHLRVLRDAGIVSARRRGRTVIYSLTSAPMVDATVQVLDRAASTSAA